MTDPSNTNQAFWHRLEVLFVFIFAILAGHHLASLGLDVAGVDGGGNWLHLVVYVACKFGVGLILGGLFVIQLGMIKETLGDRAGFVYQTSIFVFVANLIPSIPCLPPGAFFRPPRSSC